MAKGLANIIAQGILGSVMGASKAAAANAENEQKTKVLRDLESWKSDLRKGEVASLEELKLASEESKRKALEKARADFYKRTGEEAPGTEVPLPYTDVVGSPDEAQASLGRDGSAGIIGTRKEKPNRQQLAVYRAEQAKLTGRKDLLDDTYTEVRDLRAEAEVERRGRAEDRRLNTAERAAAVKEFEATLRERDVEVREQNLRALIGGLRGRTSSAPKSDLGERKFTAKQWSDAKRELASTQVFDDPISGKSKPDQAARYWSTSMMRQLQSQGDLDPVDAASAVGDVVARVTDSARAAAKGDEARYKAFVAAGMKAEAEKLTGDARGTSRTNGLKIVDPFASQAPRQDNQSPSASPSASATKKVSPPQSGPPSDQMSAKFDAETRAIEEGKLKAYSAEVRAWLEAQGNARDQERAAAESDHFQREQRRMLRKPGT